MRDLFYDLRDGTRLLSLLEVLSGERLVSNSNSSSTKTLVKVMVICIALENEVT